MFFIKKASKILGDYKKALPLHRFSKRKGLRAFSSAGSEHLPYKQRVGGSNPSTPTPHFPPQAFPIAKHGRLAQLVQSICPTSRGSAVRIRQRPPQRRLFHYNETVFFFYAFILHILRRRHDPTLLEDTRS
jgi:hypothetical protein